MHVTLIRDEAREIATTGQVVEPGETVEVDDELGASLCEQVDVWAAATPRSKPKPKAKAEATTTEEQ